MLANLHPWRSDPSGDHTRLAERTVLHGPSTSMEAIWQATVTPQTRYVVLDMDKTVVLGRNFGELLGWEISAWRGYGDQALERAEAQRPQSRFWFDWDDPGAVARYLYQGARQWARPGLFYLWWMKLAPQLGWVGRRRVRRFGPWPTEAIQRIPQVTLFQQLADIPIGTLRDLARRVVARYEDDQVITAEHIRALRARAPHVRVVLSSGSPAPVVEVVAELLGVDEAIHSTIERHDDRFSAPYHQGRAFARAGLPHRITSPDALAFNANFTKIDLLLKRLPDLLDPGVEVVGITDTSHGEDHCWARYFHTVVDLNSPDPYSPLLPAQSRTRRVHSAHVPTRAELRAHDGQGLVHLDTKRRGHPAPPDRIWTAQELRDRFPDRIERAEILARQCAALWTAHASDLQEHAAQQRDFDDTLADLIRAYNTATPAARPAHLKRLRANRDAARRAQRRALRQLAPYLDRHRDLLAAQAGLRDDLNAPPSAPFMPLAPLPAMG